MNISSEFINDSKGFSLIEIIIVITVASVLSAMMFSYFGTNIQDSARPVTRLNQSLALTETAERIAAYYKTNPGDLEGLKNALGKIGASPPPAKFGKNYTVATNKFIELYNNKYPENILKVKIRQEQTNETITLLFTKQ